MKRIAIMGLSLAVALPASVVVASAASAEAPEWGRCVKGAPREGAYKSADCTSLAAAGKKGAYEWLPGPGPANKFTITTGLVVLETTGGKTMVCHDSGPGSGEYSTTDFSKLEHVRLRLTGCQSSGFTCTTVGLDSGELELNELQGEAGWENKAKKKTALLLEPTPADDGFFIKFKCLEQADEVRAHNRGLLVKISHDKQQSTETLKYTAARGKQKPLTWHVGEPGEETDYLEAGFQNTAFHQASLEFEATLTNEEPLELNAVV